MKAVVERLTYSVYTATTKSLMERDRPLYSLLLTLEVSQTLNLTIINMPWEFSGLCEI